MAARPDSRTVKIPQPENGNAPSSWKFVDPPCPYFGRCGGCQLQHLSYSSQLIWKQNLIQEALSGIVEPERVQDTVPSPQVWNYRRRIQVHANPQGLPGFYETGSAKVLPIETCAIAAEPLNRALPLAQAHFEEVMGRRSRPSELSLELTLWPPEEVELSSDLSERFFLQVNEGANEQLKKDLQAHVLSWAPTQVLELYAGSGNFTQALFQEGMEWTAVESDPAAVAAAREKINPSTRGLQWVHAKAHAFLKGQSPGSFDWLLVDPPRAGLGPALGPLLKLKTPQVTYLSCHPQALASDMKKMLAGGYAVKSLKPYDFFPQTTHVEILVQLEFTA